MQYQPIDRHESKVLELRRERRTEAEKLEALKKESELALIDQIRRLQALPPERRTNFLRKRLAYRVSWL